MADAPKLTVELVPETCWYSNVRSNVPRAEWDHLRKLVYAAAGHRCEICGGHGRQHPVECHEVWEYDDERHVQRLARMVALCPRCHEVKHFGRAQMEGNERRALRWLKEVNGWTEAEAIHHVQAATFAWRERSRHEWELDISFLEDGSLPERIIDVDVGAMIHGTSEESE